jgi:hypothetical protein
MFKLNLWRDLAWYVRHKGFGSRLSTWRNLPNTDKTNPPLNFPFSCRHSPITTSNQSIPLLTLIDVFAFRLEASGLALGQAGEARRIVHPRRPKYPSRHFLQRSIHPGFMACEPNLPDFLPSYTASTVSEDANARNEC